MTVVKSKPYNIGVSLSEYHFSYDNDKLIGISKLNDSSVFVPLDPSSSGKISAPASRLPLIVVIEIISYLSRPISLSVRLFANMMAGHTMMKVFGGFVVSLGIVGGWLPLSFSVALTGLEILVAFLQAYVFAILTCIYLNDALNLHH